MEEIWKPIPDFEGLYEVSNYGRVRGVDRVKRAGYGSISRVKGRILKPKKNNTNDYLLISLSKDGKSKRYLLHRLVAITFIPNPNLLPQINHKDENKRNNRADNLEWCTQYYNNHYGTARERATKKRSFEVIQYSLDGNEIRRYQSSREASRIIGKSQAPISKCCTGNRRYNTAYGYVWRYAKDV